MTTVPLPRQPDQPIREQLIAALVPATSVPRPTAAPMPSLPAAAPVDRGGLGPVLIATCQPDSSSRVNAAPLLAALAWQPGDRLKVDVAHGSVVVTAAHAGRHRIGSRGDIGLPVAARMMCRIQPGEPVLLAALTGQGVLVIHPAATITRLLARLHGCLLSTPRTMP